MEGSLAPCDSGPLARLAPPEVGMCPSGNPRIFFDTGFRLHRTEIQILRGGIRQVTGLRRSIRVVAGVLGTTSQTARSKPYKQADNHQFAKHDHDRTRVSGVDLVDPSPEGGGRCLWSPRCRYVQPSGGCYLFRQTAVFGLRMQPAVSIPRMLPPYSLAASHQVSPSPQTCSVFRKARSNTSLLVVSRTRSTSFIA